MTEIWRDINDYEGLYQVSNLGRVRSLDHWVNYKNIKKRLKKSYVLNPIETNKGYFIVSLCKNGITKTPYIHRLVAMTFPDLVDWTEEAKGKPFDEIQVNHKDEFDKANNCVDNLEWCTAYYNIHYKTCLKRRGDTQKKTMSTKKPVLQYTLDMVFIKEYPSIKEASRQTGINDRHISAVCQHKPHYNTAGGYVWKYKDYSLSNPSQSKSSIST